MKHFIYKIYKPNTEFLYIGSTNKKSTRLSHHKKNTYNRVKKSYHRPLYRTIRENGGWEEFIFEIIEEMDCERQEARMREQYYINTLKPCLNCVGASVAFVPNDVGH